RVVDDKQATKSALDAGGVAVPALRDVCDAQWRVRGVMARLAAEREFVLKPARGAGGAGIVVVVDRQDERFVKASGAMLRARDLAAHACDVLAGTYSSGGRTDRLLVEELVVPEPVLGALSWRGVPDIRVLVDRRRGPLVLELNARPGLGIQLANRRGLRPLLERLAAQSVPGEVCARVALGQALAYDCGSSR